MVLDRLYKKPSSGVDDQDASLPVDDGRLSYGTGLLLKARALQVDDESGDEAAPEATRDVRHLVASAHTRHGHVYHLQTILVARRQRVMDR